MLRLYTKYLVWYDKLPETLRLGRNFTPYVLFVHMYYHFTIILLFWPFKGLEILGTALLPRNICAEAADAIGSLVKSYARLYTLQRTPSFVPYFVLTAAIVHLASNISITYASPITAEREGPESAKRTGFSALGDLKEDVTALEEMAQCHPFARKALSILSYLTQAWKVDIEVEVGDISLQECIEICRPYDQRLQYDSTSRIGGEDFILTSKNVKEQIQ
ncbi:hypothetical protein J3458_021458 [Metarhizium acridum]|uniref:uncharacterized protein n=1 Tax=Metarhizium acridum TaxID=92637 RepID=UPI001C6CFBAF|nr:hypothetical protein J3458_021458 [Metarhizium acridum]